ncbi:MAG: tetratricopeptide repeat protein, partial [Chloroflexaceae bacterium]|nr:tetratricopeptide repeat protein [Chloroflexaceae bacterium]
TGARACPTPPNTPPACANARYYAALLDRAEDTYLEGKPLEALVLFDQERQQTDAVWRWLLGQVAGDAPHADAERDQLILDMANATVYTGDMRYSTAERIPHLEAQAAAAQRLGRKKEEGNALGNLGNAHYALGDARRAITYHEQALVIRREIGDRRGEGSALGNLGIAYKELGDIPQAIAYYEQSLEVKRITGDEAGVARTCWNLGLLYEEQGDLAQAAQLMQVAADFMQQIGHAVYAKQFADGLARVRGKVSGDRGQVSGGAGSQRNE